MLLTVLAAGIAFIGAGGASAVADDAAAFERVPCWAPVDAEIDVRCGYLTVPENRQHPDGRRIRVAVAMLSAPGSASASEVAPIADAAAPPRQPLVYLNGGPGIATGLSGDDFAWWLDWFSTWRGRHGRTLILVDQRGTGESEPLLSCDPETRRRDILAYYARPSPRDPRDDQLMHRDYLMACRAPFDAAGIDVTAYNRAETAADIAALRQALSIAHWDVWGASYGTSLALELLRIDEAGIRSLILDAVSLYERPAVVTPNTAAAFHRALTVVTRDCLRDAECKGAFYRLPISIGSGLLWLRYWPQPLTLPKGVGWDDATFILDDRRMTMMLFVAMYDPTVIPYLPVFVQEVVTRRYDFFGPMATVLLETMNDPRQSELVVASTDCRDAPTGADLATLRDQEGHFPDYRALWFTDYIDTVCAGWGTDPASAAEIGPVRSQVPALILGGRYDPVTPPEWGRIVAGWLPNSTFLEFPRMAHVSVTVDPCADAIAAAFLARPDEDPQQACFAALETPDFVVP